MRGTITKIKRSCIGEITLIRTNITMLADVLEDLISPLPASWRVFGHFSFAKYIICKKSVPHAQTKFKARNYAMMHHNFHR